MITEDYCSYEVAQLLKEKGFLKGIDLRLIPNLAFYDNIGLRHNVAKWYDSLIQDKIDFVVAPTLQMAMKWLREVHGIFIGIQPYDSYYEERYDFEISIRQNNSYEWDFKDAENSLFEGYENTIEAALKYCLENLL